MSSIKTVKIAIQKIQDKIKNNPKHPRVNDYKKRLSEYLAYLQRNGSPHNSLESE